VRSSLRRLEDGGIGPPAYSQSTSEDCVNGATPTIVVPAGGIVVEQAIPALSGWSSKRVIAKRHSITHRRRRRSRPPRDVGGGRPM